MVIILKRFLLQVHVFLVQKKIRVILTYFYNIHSLGFYVLRQHAAFVADHILDGVQGHAAFSDFFIEKTDADHQVGQFNQLRDLSLI